LGFTPRDDEHFRHWPKPIRDEDVRRGIFLRNLLPLEERAAFLRERGQCWLDHLQTGHALEAFTQALALRPHLPGLECAWQIASLLHAAVEWFGHEALLATPAAEIRLPPGAAWWEPTLHALAVEQLRRISYTEGRGPKGPCAENVALV